MINDNQPKRQDGLRAGRLTVDEVTRCTDCEQNDFTIVFRVERDVYSLDCTATAIQSYKAFQRAALESLGVMVRDHDCEHGGRFANRCWARMVDRAIREGGQA